MRRGEIFPPCHSAARPLNRSIAHDTPRRPAWRRRLADTEHSVRHGGAGWLDRQPDLALIAQSQLFFVGGAPRSGTTWLQQMLDSHPEVSCGGEGLFYLHLAQPLDRLVQDRAAAIQAKNERIFGHTGGYALPTAEDADLMLGTGILAAMQRQAGGRRCRAYGEKTPENVFAFERLRRIFPRARLLAIVRDPRDVLASSWHFFQKAPPGMDEAEAKRRFVEASLPSMARGIEVALRHMDADPRACTVVSYERLLADPAAELARLFAFIGVPNGQALVAACVERTRFDRLSRGRAAGEVRNGDFHRAGTAGTWRDTFGPDVDALVQDRLDRAFARLGWAR